MNRDRAKKRNKLMEKYARFCDMVLLSCLFIATCIPVFTIGASIAALYYAVTKVFVNDEGYLFRSYIDAWKSNMKQGAVLTLITLLYAALCAADAFLIGRLVVEGRLPAVSGLLRWALFIPLILVLPWEFIYMSRFNDSTGRILGNSLKLGAARADVTLFAAFFMALAAAAAVLLPPSLPFIITPVCLLISKKTEPVLSELSKTSEGFDPKAWYNTDRGSDDAGGTKGTEGLTDREKRL